MNKSTLSADWIVAAIDTRMGYWVIKPAFSPRFTDALGTLFKQPSTTLTSLNISQTKLGVGLVDCIGFLADNTALIHLDVSGAGARPHCGRLATALATALQTNRTLTSLKMKNNEIDFNGYAAVKKMLGGCNPQVLYIVSRDCSRSVDSMITKPLLPATVTVRLADLNLCLVNQ